MLFSSITLSKKMAKAGQNGGNRSVGMKCGGTGRLLEMSRY